MVHSPRGSLKAVADRALRDDSPREFAYVAGAFVVYGLLDQGTRLLADVDGDRLSGSVLVFGAVASNPVVFVGIMTLLLVAVWRWPRRMWSRWESLEQGRTLRLIALPLLLLLAWQGSLYPYNFLLEQTHAFDRVLLAALAVGCLARPAFLVPFAIQSRVITNQFDHPFGTRVGQNRDELLVIALLAIAVAHLLYVLSGRNQTAPVVLLLGAAIATHFYIPGRSKLMLGWATTTDMSNFPLSGYTAGWQGQGDGSWAERMSDLARSVGRPGLLASLVFEVGAAFAVIHHRLLRLWLPGCLIFHAFVFAFVGFWFMPWIVLEISLILVLTRRSLRPWLAQNATPARALLTFGAVVIAGNTLFHPPSLSWLDSPISFGYRVEAIGESGNRYNIPASAFAPYEQEISFYRLRLGPLGPIGGPYGAIESPDWYRELQTLTTFDEVDLRADPVDPQVQELSRDFMASFMNDANHRGGSRWTALAPPDRFWTSAPGPSFDFDEPLKQLDVYVLTAIHRNGEQEARRELVFTLTVEADGIARAA